MHDVVNNTPSPPFWLCLVPCPSVLETQTGGVHGHIRSRVLLPLPASSALAFFLLSRFCHALRSARIFPSSNHTLYYCCILVHRTAGVLTDGLLTGGGGRGEASEPRRFFLCPKQQRRRRAKFPEVYRCHFEWQLEQQNI